MIRRLSETWRQEKSLSNRKDSHAPNESQKRRKVNRKLTSILERSKNVTTLNAEESINNDIIVSPPVAKQKSKKDTILGLSSLDWGLSDTLLNGLESNITSNHAESGDGLPNKINILKQSEVKGNSLSGTKKSQSTLPLQKTTQNNNTTPPATQSKNSTSPLATRRRKSTTPLATQPKKSTIPLATQHSNVEKSIKTDEGVSKKIIQENKKDEKIIVESEFSSSDSISKFSSSFKENLKLGSWNLPENVLQKYIDIGITNMFPWQLECLSTGNALEGGNLVYSAPTSAGKTLIAELLMLKRVIDLKKKALFILPFVSVAREKMFALRNLLEDVGIRVGGFMGSEAPAGGLKSVDIAVCTIEKANSIINHLMEEKKTNCLCCVVVDELHLIGDSNRGYLLEVLLTKIIYMSASIKKCFTKENSREVASETQIIGMSATLPNLQETQIIGMSATLPNLQMIADWLKASLYVTNFRPVPLKELFKIGNNLMNTCGDVISSFETFAPIKGDEEKIIPLVLETLNEGKSVLVFCPTKVWCEKLSNLLAMYLATNTEKKFTEEDKIEEVLEQLRRCAFGLDRSVGRVVSQGVAFHHAGLTFDERDIIEGSFRRGILKIIVATSTLSSGVNLPARRVIIRSPIYRGKAMDPLVYKQMAGRAGRKGVDTLGESVLMCKSNEKEKIITLMNAPLKPVHSCLLGSCMDEKKNIKRAILEIIAGGVAVTRDDVERYCTSSYFHSCLSLQQKADEEALIKETIEFLLQNEFVALQKNSEVSNEQGGYFPTQLGVATLASSLSPDEALLVLQELHKARKSFVLECDLHMIYQVTPIFLQDQWPDLDWTTYFHIWERLSDIDQLVAERVGVSEDFLSRAICNRLSNKGKQQQERIRIHKRFFTALVLQDLVNEIPLACITRKFNINRGLLQSLQNSAATFAGMVTVFCKKLGWNGMELLLEQFQTRLTFGVARELCALVRINLLNAFLARKLYESGYHNATMLAYADRLEIAKILRDSLPFERKIANNASIRCIRLNGREGLTENEAAELLINEAKRLVKEDAAILGVAVPQNIDLFLHTNQLDLHKNQPNLHVNQHDFHKNQPNLHVNQHDFHKNQPNLHVNQHDFHKNQPNLHVNQHDFHKNQPNLHVNQHDFHKNQLHLHIEQPHLHKNQHSLHKSHSDLHKNQPNAENDENLEEMKNASKAKKRKSKENEGLLPCVNPDREMTSVVTNGQERDEIFRKRKKRKSAEKRQNSSIKEKYSIDKESIAVTTNGAAVKSVNTETNNARRPKCTNKETTKTRPPKFTEKDVIFCGGDINENENHEITIPETETLNENMVSPVDLFTPLIRNADRDQREKTTIFDEQPFLSPTTLFPQQPSHNKSDISTDIDGVAVSPDIIDTSIRSKNVSHVDSDVTTSLNFDCSVDLIDIRSANNSIDLIASDSSFTFVSPQPLLVNMEKSSRLKYKRDSLEMMFSSSFNFSQNSSQKTRRRVSSTNNTDEEFTIIDVTANLELFRTFLDELTEQVKISIAFSLAPLPVETSSIGCNLKKKSNDASSKNAIYQFQNYAITGLAFCWGGVDAYYVDMNNDYSTSFNDTRPSTLGLRYRIDAMKKLFSICSKKEILAHDMKSFLKHWYHVFHNLLDEHDLRDPTVAQWMLGPDDTPRPLYELVHLYLAKEWQVLAEAVGERLGYKPTNVKTLTCTPRAQACVESVLVLQLMDKMNERLSLENLLPPFIELEMRMLRTLAVIEINGLGFSKETFDDLKMTIDTLVEQIENQCFQLAGRKFSLSSPSDIAQVLFIELGLPANGDVTNATRQTRLKQLKNVKSLSTSKKILEKLTFHPLPGLVMEWRKLNSTLVKVAVPVSKQRTFVDDLNMCRIFSESQFTTSTGRISFVEPNLQNVPKPFDVVLIPGNNSSKVNMRSVFIPHPSSVFISADYSQLELRIIAHLSDDEKLKTSLNSNQDVFKNIAAELKQIHSDEVSPAERQIAKQICYGILYGIGVTSLAEQLKVDEEDARNYMDDFMSKFTGVKKFIKQCVESVREKGFITTIAKRKRYLRDIHSSNPAARSHAERQAVNSTVQGSAADLVKSAMININRKLYENYGQICHLKGRTKSAFLVLQIHDELLYEVSSSETEYVSKLLRHEMENALKLSVSTPVKVKIGRNWGALCDVESS